MENQKVKIDVQFRILDNEVIAVFPYIIESIDDVQCYTLKGQHSACAWNINQFTTAAKPKQYEALKRELESIGYIVNIIKRRNQTKYIKLCYSEKKKRDLANV